MASPYWQHRSPLKCPLGHVMSWLGSVFWSCGRSGCKQVYVAAEPSDAGERGKA
jgi:hypothetical protein